MQNENWCSFFQNPWDVCFYLHPINTMLWLLLWFLLWPISYTGVSMWFNPQISVDLVDSLGLGLGGGLFQVVFWSSRSPAARADLELAVKPRMTLNLWPACCLLQINNFSAVIRGHCWTSALLVSEVYLNTAQGHPGGCFRCVCWACTRCSYCRAFPLYGYMCPLQPARVCNYLDELWRTPFVLLNYFSFQLSLGMYFGAIILTLSCVSLSSSWDAVSL